jgi:hypothetical protein
VASSSPSVNAQESSEPRPPARTAVPWKNPTYPARTHWAEKASLEETLQSWDRKIEALAQKFAVLGNAAGRAPHERIYHQMLGARDQMAEAVRRMPRETGALYHEDHERLAAAEAALLRLVQRWDALKS